MSLPKGAVLAASVARSRAVARGWRESAGWLRTAGAFTSCTNAEQVAEAAVGLFADDDWLDGLIRPLVAALAADPWFDPPLRIKRDASRIGAVLFESEAVSIAAQVLRPVSEPAAGVVLSGRVSVLRCLAGQGRLRLGREGEGSEDQPISTGDMQVIDGRQAGYAVEPIGGDLMLLTATTPLDAAPLARLIRLDNGEPLRTATTDDRAARAQLLLAFLRADGRREAVSHFAAATHDLAWFLRWDAMREWLALDAASALPRLIEMTADDPHVEVRAAARATLDLLAARKAA